MGMDALASHIFAKKKKKNRVVIHYCSVWHLSLLPFYILYKDKALFGWIPGSRASLFVDSPNFRKKSPRCSGEDVAVCSLSSYHGRTHWAEGHPLSPKSWVKVSCLSRGRGRMELKKGGLNGWWVKDTFLCHCWRGSAINEKKREEEYG